jgi:predicted nucleic acid-binding protein
MKKNDVYFHDACALLAAIREEEGAFAVVELYELAESGKIRLFINKINLLEVYYGIHRERGKKYAYDTLRSIINSTLNVTDTSYDVLAEVGRLKSVYCRVSLADCIALGKASVSGGTIVTADHHEMDIIERNEDINFLWIR